jgi:glycosyltransferase involved in cell wall biosynthesis
MKKIVIDARESGTTTGRYIDKLIEYLYKLRPEYDFVILTKSHRLDYLKKLAPGFEIVESNIKEFTFGEQLALKKQLDGLKPDLVHFGMVQQPVRYSGTVVTTMHDLTTTRFRNPDKNPVVFKAKQQVYKWVNKEVAKKSKYIITATNYVKDDLVDYAGISPSKIFVTNESADFIEDQPKPVAKLTGKQFIMYVGNATPHKNLDRLVEAFKLIQESNPSLYLALGGKTTSNYKALAEKVAMKNIQNVVFTDFVSEGQLRWMYENCVAYVFPSLSEGFGLPGLEAMIHGAPVISSNATCLPEVYGDAAYYFYPYHTKEIANAIEEIVKNQKLREELVAKGKDQVKKYSWQKMAEQTIDVYKKVLKEN